MSSSELRVPPGSLSFFLSLSSLFTNYKEETKQRREKNIKKRPQKHIKTLMMTPLVLSEISDGAHLSLDNSYGPF
jgi:hypothetical protein